MRKQLVCGLATISLAASTLSLTAGFAPADAKDTKDTKAAGGSSATAPVRLAKSSITWGTCSDEILSSRGAECAMVKVPLNYSKPNGKKIQIAVSRKKHTGRADQYQGPMLINTGGPGGSGLLGPLYFSSLQPATNNYDLIGFDPRGVGASKPAVSCDPNYAGYNRPDYRPFTPKLYNAWMKRTKAYTKACAKNNGAILDHMTTRDSAKDMESIRKALGAPVINYWGWSYGTYLGSVYASLYPTKTRRMVFDSTVDPRGVWYEANLDQDVAFDKNINIWFGWLAKYDSVYHLGNTQAKVKKVFFDTQEALYKKPVQAKGGKLGGSEWIDSFLYAGYYQTTWTDLASVFSAYINDHDVDALEGAYLDASGYGDDNGYAVYLGVQCTDTSWPKSWDTWARDNWNTWAKAPYETWSNAWYNEPCRHWPGKSRTPVPIKDKGVSSILMIDETLDAATPYAGSIEVRKRFAGARLISEPGGTSHAMSPGYNSCVDEKLIAYLSTGDMPDRKAGNVADATCTATPQPDPTAATTARKAQTKSASDLNRRLLQPGVRP